MPRDGMRYHDTTKFSLTLRAAAAISRPLFPYQD
jgi:hypothetical protein